MVLCNTMLCITLNSGLQAMPFEGVHCIQKLISGQLLFFCLGISKELDCLGDINKLSVLCNDLFPNISMCSQVFFVFWEESSPNLVKDFKQKKYWRRQILLKNWIGSFLQWVLCIDEGDLLIVLTLISITQKSTKSNYRISQLFMCGNILSLLLKIWLLYHQD